MSVSVGYPGRQVAPACATVRQADYSLKWIVAAKFAQWHSLTLGRLSGPIHAARLRNVLWLIGAD